MRWVMRIGLTTSRTTAPLTRSPGEYFLYGSSGLMWKSCRFRVLDFNGEVRRDKKDRPAEGVDVTEATVEFVCACDMRNKKSFGLRSNVPDAKDWRVPRPVTQKQDGSRREVRDQASGDGGDYCDI